LVLVEEIVVTPEVLSAEPLANNLIALTTKGAVDLSTLKVKLNGKVQCSRHTYVIQLIFGVQTIALKGNTTMSPADTPSKSITYMTLATSLSPGNLSIIAGDAAFSFVLPPQQSTTYGSTISLIIKRF